MAKVRDHIFNGVYPSLFPCTTRIPIITIGSIVANKCLKRKLCYSSCIGTDVIHHILLCVCRNSIACPFIWFLMLFILLYSIYIACSISYINSDKCYCTVCSWALYVVETLYTPLAFNQEIPLLSLTKDQWRRSLSFLCDYCLNNLLSKHRSRQWFEALWHYAMRTLSYIGTILIQYSQ